MDLYINYFSELKGQSYKEQYDMLSKAKHEAFVVMGLRQKKYINTFLILVLSTSIALFPEAIFELNLFLKVMFHMLGISVCIYLERKNYGNVLHQGLAQILRHDS